MDGPINAETIGLRKSNDFFSLQTYGVPTGTVAGTVVGFSVAG